MATLSGAEKESIHAARGTAAHEVSENCLRTGKDAVDFLGTVVHTKQHKIEIDEEITESAQVYVDHVRKLAGTPPGEPVSGVQLEQQFSLDMLSPPFDAGGTADAVIHYTADALLEVIDLKNGTGVVDAKENPQLRTYALGAMLANPHLDVDYVKVTIVQPRAAHKDGRIRSEMFHVSDLIEWTALLLAAMQRAAEAKDEFGRIAGNSVRFDEWADRWLRPGKCTFCPAEGFCPKLRKQAVQRMDPKLAAKWFDDVPSPSVSSASTPNIADTEDGSMVARDLNAFDEIESWIKARRAFAHTLAERGTEVPGWMLVDKIGHRKWACEDEAKLVHDLTKGVGLAEDDIYERKLKSPAGIDKLLGKEKSKKIELMWHKPVTGTNLVSVSKSTRPAAKPKVEQFLDKETD